MPGYSNQQDKSQRVGKLQLSDEFLKQLEQTVASQKPAPQEQQPENAATNAYEPKWRTRKMDDSLKQQIEARRPSISDSQIIEEGQSEEETNQLQSQQTLEQASYGWTYYLTFGFFGASQAQKDHRYNNEAEAKQEQPQADQPEKPGWLSYLGMGSRN